MIFQSFVFSSFETGTVNGPDIRKLMKSRQFTRTLRGNALAGWKAIQEVIKNVLGKKRETPEKMKQLVAKMLSAFKKLGSSMTLKLHFLNNHLEEFLKQSPLESDEQGERYHQITMPMEKRFKGKRIDAMIGDVCWWSTKISLYQAPEDEEEDEEDDEDYEGAHDEPMVVSDDSDDEPLRSRLKRRKSMA